MKNYIQPGNVVTLPAPAGGALSGQALLIGSLFGVAAYTALQGADVEVLLEGVYELPKATGALVAGAKAFWDSTNRCVTGMSAGNTPIGAVVAAVASAALTARVRLDGKSV